MKSQLIRIVSVTLLAAAYTFAQESHRAVVQIPFGFHVGASTLPAGEYTMATETRTQVLTLQSSDAKAVAMVLTIPIGPGNGSSNGKLVFNRYGEQYFLSQIWAPGSGDRSGLRKTKREIEVAASESRKVETVMARQ